MNGQAQYSIDNGYLVIKYPIDKNPTFSKSGKSIVIASSRGNQTTSLLHDGRPVVVSVNAYVKA